MESIKPETITKLETYFHGRSDVAMAFLFGSRACGRAVSESDLDIAVYFRPAGPLPDIETKTRYPGEDEIWNRVEAETGINTDLVVLNRAAAAVGVSALCAGKPLAINDRNEYLKFMLAASSQAEDYREFIEDYCRIARRSQSLSETDKSRLRQLIYFLETETQEFDQHRSIDYPTYQQDKVSRRNIERWTETLVMALIDSAKILLASSKQEIPETYYEVIQRCALVFEFTEPDAAKLAGYARLRNILSHNYLDLRYERIRDFLDTGAPLYRRFIDAATAHIR